MASSYTLSRVCKPVIHRVPACEGVALIRGCRLLVGIGFCHSIRWLAASHWRCLLRTLIKHGRQPGTSAGATRLRYILQHRHETPHVVTWQTMRTPLTFPYTVPRPERKPDRIWHRCAASRSGALAIS